MKILFCGGRCYGANDIEYNAAADVYDQLVHREDVIIQGGASGADSIIASMANRDKQACITYTAEWKKHGRAAGPIRNKRMLDEGKPDLVVAFPGGSGTENMIKQALDAGVIVLRVELPNPVSALEPKGNGG